MPFSTHNFTLLIFSIFLILCEIHAVVYRNNSSVVIHILTLLIIFSIHFLSEKLGREDDNWHLYTLINIEEIERISTQTIAPVSASIIGKIFIGDEKLLFLFNAFFRSCPGLWSRIWKRINIFFFLFLVALSQKQQKQGVTFYDILRLWLLFSCGSFIFSDANCVTEKSLKGLKPIEIIFVA